MRSSGVPAGRDRHGWNRWDNYLAAHYSQIDRLLDEGFLVEDRLAIDVSGNNTVTIEGTLRCQHGLVIEVAKALEIEGNRVRTFKYKYHAAFADPHRPIFRYDDAHDRSGHPDRHHKHVFVPVGSPEPGRVEWVGHDRWPALSQVVDEPFDWRQEIGQFLPQARSAPPRRGKACSNGRDPNPPDAIAQYDSLDAIRKVSGHGGPCGR